jgi:hypothetical protein
VNVRTIILVICCTTALPAYAQWAGWDYDNDREIKPWSELQAKVPPYPKDEDLLRFDAGSATAHRFFVDPGSISIGEDGVVRYILVVRTSGGAKNVTFEGMRCETREQKTYAIGHSDGSWARARNPQWRRVEYREVNRHHGVLYREFFCRGKVAVDSVKQIVASLRNPPLPSSNE